MATRLGEAVGLPMPKTEVVEVTEWLIANTADLHVEPQAGRREHCRAGLQFGCEYVAPAGRGQVLDYLPEEQLRDVKNLDAFAGVLALDKWAGNCNGRQAVFSRRPRERRYRATFIDQGFCFNVAEWNFPDSPKRGVYGRDLVYEGVKAWSSFEPWLSRIEELEPEVLWRIAETVPPEWYDGDSFGLERLIQDLLRRRKIVRELIEAFRDSDRNPFPNWRSESRMSLAASGTWLQ